MIFEFGSDTNQRLFCDMLDDRNVPYYAPQARCSVNIADGDVEDWVINEAAGLGAVCS